MNIGTEAAVDTEQLNEISVLLNQKLEEARERDPQSFPKQVCILPPVDQQKPNALVKRLQQAKNDAKAEQIILIPYFIKQGHWIGLLLQFNTATELERAEYFNPTSTSSFDPTTVIDIFHAVYPTSTVSSHRSKEHTNSECSANHTIDDMISAVKDFHASNNTTSGLTRRRQQVGNDEKSVDDSSDPDTAQIRIPHDDRMCASSNMALEARSLSNLSTAKFNEAVNRVSSADENHARNTCQQPQLPTTNHESLSYTAIHSVLKVKPTPDFATDRIAEYRAIKAELDKQLEENDIPDVQELEKRIDAKRDEIRSLDEASKTALANRRRNSLKFLEEIRTLSDQVKELEPRQSASGSLNDLEQEYRAMKAELDKQLEENGISDVRELAERIDAKRDEIRSLDEVGRTALANRRRNSLKILEEIRTLSDQVRELEPRQSASGSSDVLEQEYRAIKAELDKQLEENDIPDVRDLEKRIDAKRDEIRSLDEGGKTALANRRRNSLKVLEEIRTLSDQVKALEPRQPVSRSSDVLEQEYRAMKAELDKQLEENDIPDVRDLEKRIDAKRDEIRSLDEGGKTALANRRRNSITELEGIKALYERVKASQLICRATEHSTSRTAQYCLFESEVNKQPEGSDFSGTKEREQRIDDTTGQIGSDGSIVSTETLRRREKLKRAQDEMRSPKEIVTRSKRTESIQNDVDRVERDDSLETILPAAPKLLAELDLKHNILTDEALEDLSNDFKECPPCFERSMFTVMFLTALKAAPRTLDVQCRSESPDDIDQKIIDEIDVMEYRLNNQEFPVERISNVLESCKSFVRNQNWSGVLKEFQKLRKQLISLNIQELRRLVSKVDHSARLIKDRDIILLIGGTGTGKSTTVHFLGGSEMIRTRIDGMSHIMPTKIKSAALKRVETAPSTSSITRYITPIIINLKDIGGDDDASIILCDSPGFEDTSGAEVDIANGIGIVKGIRGCRSVKPVVLVSYKSTGDRCTGIKDLAHTLVGIIPDFKDHARSFTYLFTKFPSEEKDGIHAMLKDLRKNLREEEKLDVSFTNILDDMIKKTRKGANVIDPINDDPLELIEDLMELVAIQNPQEVFHSSITEKSKSSVLEQVRADQLAIITATKRFDYPYICYKLDQLKYLDNLLEQDYIRQIYNDSITFVSKHLTDQFNAAKTTFERCLLHQTTVSKDDLDQFKTSFKLAQQADELRTEHLTSDVVHSGAYLPCVIQLAQTLYDEVKEKDIDEASVKVGLDKIKLLATVFTDVDKIYQDVLQLFTDKHSLAVKNVKKSVHAHEFVETANNMRALNGAITVLADHVDREQLQTTYTTQQDFFTTYLTASTTKLDGTFTRKLDHSDIENLNRCVCMFESIDATFALHTHVSREIIQRIRDTLSDKVINYFNERVDHISKSMKTKTDLSTLEQLMAELDAIRTISGFNIKTTQSYFSTLEQLIGYINECKRDVETLLHAFFQQESVDFRRLSTSLAALQSAKWINKYRDDVYSDVIGDVEHQICEQLELMTKSVKQTNLGLDRAEKIRDVYQVIVRINQMKPLNRLFLSIDQQISEINTWFITVTNNVFDSIRSTFDSEKWKEQEYRVPDFSTAETGLHYLSICKEIPLHSEGTCDSTLTSLREFIRGFYQHIQNDMNNRFERIKRYQLGSEGDLDGQARILTSHLQEIIEMKQKYQRVFSYFTNQRILEDWKDRICDYYVTLQEEVRQFSQTNKVEDLQAKLSIAKALSKTDNFLGDCKFMDLYKQYQDAFFTNADGACRRAIEAINKKEYDIVAAELAVLKTKDRIGEHFLQQARRAINFGVRTLAEETKNKTIMLGQDIEHAEVMPIVANLKKLQLAQQFISDFLDEPGAIGQCVEEVKTLIATPMKRFIERVKAFITVNNFFEADKRIDSITLSRNLLGVYCTDAISIEITELRNNQSEMVSKVVKTYKEMDINAYTLNPPTEIFTKFEAVSNINPIYDQAYKDIREATFTKFRAALDKAKSFTPLSTDNTCIRQFESAVKYLPKDMRESLEGELKHCKDDITNLLRDQNETHTRTLESGDLSAIRGMMEQYRDSGGMKGFFDRGAGYIMDTTRGLIEKVQTSFRDHDITTALEHVKTMHAQLIKFQDLVTDIKKPYSDIHKQVTEVFENAYHSFFNGFLNTDVSTLTKSVVDTTEKSFEELSDYIKFSSKYRDLSSLQEMLPEEYHQKMYTLNEKLTHSFTRSETQYQDALDPISVSSLKTCLEAAEKWYSLIIKMKKCYAIHHIHVDSNNDLYQALTNLTPFERMREAVDKRLEQLRDQLIRQVLINDETSGFVKQRDDFYKKLAQICSILSQSKELSQYRIKFDTAAAESRCLTELEKQVQSIHNTASKIFQQFIQNAPLTRSDYEQFNLSYNNLISYNKEMRILGTNGNLSVEVFQQMIEQKFQDWATTVAQGTSLDVTAQVLIQMKSASNNFLPFKSQIDQRIDMIIMQTKSSRTNSTAFSKLGVLLNQDSTGVGQRIIAEHKAFQGYSLSLFNEKTQKHGIEYVLEHLKGDRYDAKKLRRRYDEFHQIYQRLVHQYLVPNIRLDALISTTKILAGNVRQQTNKIEWDAIIRNKVPQLAAHIFALWTLQSAHHFFEATDIENKNSYLLQPHAAQVIAIFRMLGIGDDKEELNNNLVQIGTGEGKSVTLGATATLLALLGFDVYCASYSAYLSERDYRSFLPLFNSLDIISHIHYATFNQLCEHIINDDGDVRQLAEQLISKDINQALDNAKQMKRVKILLIDEVDVFFSRDFYGNIYTPSATLTDPTVTALINYIWKHRQNKLSLKRLRDTQEYENCCARFPAWEALMCEAIKDMIADLKSFESHNYVVKDDKIGYVEQDNIVFNIVYGYKTLFAYFLEHERNKISRARLDEKISIIVKCGGYSYAEIPLQFKYIMGVTGTLETLSDSEQQVISKMYKISKQTIMPSVFGKNNLQFTKKDDIRIENSDDYYNVIRREIDDRLRGSSGHRAVLVFFESDKKLNDFYTSDSMKTIQDSVAILTEEASADEKESIIRRAIASGQVTLFTKTFGRGTDFICYDPNVASSGGAHVIQTFLSEEVSEEVQIKGRTARQGDHGSYSMILLEKDLEKFDIDPAELKDVRDGKPVLVRAFLKVTTVAGLTEKCESVYDLLNQKRIAFFKTQYDANTQYVNVVRKRHEQSQNFLANLKSGNTDAVKMFLAEENGGIPETFSSRTLCLMDATGSMSHLLQKSKNTVSVMFDRAAEVLRESGFSADCFQIQVAVYRNYCCRKEKILQHSPWETKADNLRAFMNTIDVEGGLGNEAIEIGLWHANEETMREEITQVILIGDAPPNTRDEVIRNRQRLGEDYWKTTEFVRPTYYEDELNKLRSQKIPVHAFYVADRAKKSFGRIAQQNGGRCEFLAINSPSGSEMLTNLVTEEVLRNVGGSERGSKLVDIYRAKFGRAYVS